MENILRLNHAQIGSSNLEYILGLLLENQLTSLSELNNYVNGGNTVGDIMAGGYIDFETIKAIDLPSLGYRFTDVTMLQTKYNYYNKRIYHILDFRIEKIYHLVNYSASKDKKLCFWRDNNGGYTFDLGSAGCYLGGALRKNLEHYHNGAKSTAIWSKDLYSGLYSRFLAVDYTFRSEVQSAVEHRVLEYSDIKEGKKK